MPAVSMISICLYAHIHIKTPHTGVANTETNLSVLLIRLFGLDIDECSKNLHHCHHHGYCTNIKGSYNCSCNVGYSGNGFNCLGTTGSFGV